MSDSVHILLDRLDLETLDSNLFRGHSPQDGRPRVYGGQVVGQALVAACRTVQGRLAHSLHAYFLRPGDPSRPILYEVDRIRDGRSFTTRRVVAIQKGEAIFSMSASFHAEERGLEHQLPAPEAAPPESVPSNSERIDEALAATGNPLFEFLKALERPIEQRDLDAVDPTRPRKHQAPHRVWFRAGGALPDDPLIHQCVLAYASDLSLLDSCILWHGVTWLDPRLMAASLDHAIWFHRPFRADEWLLYVCESPSSASGRGMNHGRIFRADGTLVASVAQEALMRMTDPLAI
ncbi:MAG: acyl-CoA thioesterase II [Polyangiaceae bacterium]|nr:acyl-CoA thioesterase II [Polyangiaceae bacterium]